MSQVYVCPSCGEEAETTHGFCPLCGEELKKEEETIELDTFEDNEADDSEEVIGYGLSSTKD